MNETKIFNYFEIAGQTAARGDRRRKFLLGAVGIRSDGTLVKSFNGPTRYPMRSAHAEYRVSKKLDVGSLVYVARISLDYGEFAIARPCKSCFKAMKYRGVKRVYYTVGPNEFGWIDINNENEVIKNKTIK